MISRMDVFEFAEHILLDGTLESKLLDPQNIDWSLTTQRTSQRVIIPRRDEKIAFSEEQTKFPKRGALKDKKQRGKALHFFANHELLAIEMMASAILLFPSQPISSFKSLVDTISEEQTHLQLYIERMNEFGIQFGDFPLNQFFWSYMANIDDMESFYSIMALTFEQANLDFSLYYRELFKELEDHRTAEIMDIIYQDEIKHVARGRAHLAKVHIKEEQAESFWDYFLELLPSNLSADRAKGIVFDEMSRRKAGFDMNFINNLKNYRSDFKVTQRKEWK